MTHYHLWIVMTSYGILMTNNYASEIPLKIYSMCTGTPANLRMAVLCQRTPAPKVVSLAILRSLKGFHQ